MVRGVSVVETLGQSSEGNDNCAFYYAIIRLEGKEGCLEWFIVINCFVSISDER